jgi:voltage-gated potassium channel Kch
MPVTDSPQPDPEDALIIRQYRIVASITLVVILGGAIFYHLVEKLSWLNAVYFCVITLATVGYGDITPKTDAEKLFTIFYVLIGIGIIATFVNLLVKRASLRHRRR